MNRIEPIRFDIQSEKNIDDRMELIMYALNDTVTPIPEEGNICTFKYFAKTPNISYDQPVSYTHLTLPTILLV